MYRYTSEEFKMSHRHNAKHNLAATVKLKGFLWQFMFFIYIYGAERMSVKHCPFRIIVTSKHWK